MDIAWHVAVLHTAPYVSPSSATSPTLTFVPFDGENHHQIFRRPSSSNPTLYWSKAFDIPSKRNYAIAHAKKKRFRTILLVDDDIVFRRSFIPSALKLLNQGTDIACSYSLLSPDVSTLERVRYLITGARPEVSISGNAMVLKVGPRLGLFPYIYNEDWLFLWSSREYGSATLTPFQNVIQRRPRKGREELVQMEQFGELIAFLLFEHGVVRRDLASLQNESLIREGIGAYRHSLRPLLSDETFRPVVAQALLALDSITVTDVLSFCQNFDRELRCHYGSTITD